MLLEDSITAVPFTRGLTGLKQGGDHTRWPWGATPGPPACPCLLLHLPESWTSGAAPVCVDHVPQGPSPAITVGGIHIDPKVQQELHDVVVAGADGVVQWGDAFVIGLARVFHLRTQGACEPHPPARRAAWPVAVLSSPHR